MDRDGGIEMLRVDRCCSNLPCKKLLWTMCLRIYGEEGCMLLLTYYFFRLL